MTIAVAGLGTTGFYVAQHLMDMGRSDLRLHDPDPDAVRRARRTAPNADFGPILDRKPPVAAVVATPCGPAHVGLVRSLIQAGSHVVSVSDSPTDVDELLELDDLVRAGNVTLAAGEGMAPGLSCLLARHAGDQLDVVDSINVAKAGTAGPACARQHHQALKSPGRDWVGAGWELRTGGSGRDLAWFPEPIGARDCYRGALPSPVLLHRTYPGAQRLSARASATRRDRLTSRLPMLRKPHADGGPGAVRAEVRGWRDGRAETIVYAVMAFPSVAAGAVAAVVAGRAVEGRTPPGASGLSEWPNANRLLNDVRLRGISISEFCGGSDRPVFDTA